MATNPTLLIVPIAQNGTKNTIPQNQATPGNGLMSQSTGFPAECSLPLGAGGVAPDRADFNGAFNLLGGVAFMAQKGFTFNYDAGQDYYTGCVVIDPADGNRYLCIADMAAGTVAPHSDTAHTYWAFYPVGVINKRDVITTSGTYTAPVTGWYKITAKGGGGGGQGGGYVSGSWLFSGGGGGEGGTTIGFEKMTAGDTATIVIGAGGTGGTYNSNGRGSVGTEGGYSSVIVNGNSYFGGGGYQGVGGNARGGYGTIAGQAGGGGESIPSSNVVYGPNRGTSGGRGYGTSGGADGSGGYGGSGGPNGDDGVAGNQGFVWFEYFDPTLM